MMRFSRRFVKGMTGNFNYTYSKAMDIVDNDSDQINNPFNIARNTRRPVTTRLTSFSTDWVYNLPNFTNKRGLGIPPKWLGADRHPQHSLRHAFFRLLRRKSDGYNAGTQYVNVSGNVYASQNSSQWINPAAFMQPPDGSYGTTGRNAFRLPWIQNLDGSLMKNFLLLSG